jgi:mono/diheme cytochrome c family protein
MLEIGFVFRIGSIVTTFVLMLFALTSFAAPVNIDQGTEWTASTRKDFYSRDQGSRLMPLSWIIALKQPNGEPFLAESLVRYGYLPNETSQPAGLPVGFTVASGRDGQEIGMNCAACHTREIEVAGTSYRIDGGPGIVDFQSFLADLDVAVNAVLTNRQAFTDFAHSVLGPSPTEAEKSALRMALKAWYVPYHTLVERALPAQPWGPARLDAVSMIFNRLTGLDIGPPPTYMIPENIQPAIAPVRYPFLWNAAIQDKTQWPGFASNGNDILGLARNLGEVYGVFGVFHPKKDAWRLLGIDYLANNSANFQGLGALEDLIKKIGPPKWPWSVDLALAGKGQAIFARKTDAGGCADCHGIAPGETRFLNQRTWRTPIMDVGTDSREYEVLGRTVKTGVLEGAKIPFLAKPLKPVDTAFNVLGTAVLGSILQHYVPVLMKAENAAQANGLESPFPPETESLKGAFTAPEVTDKPSYAYESRVLEGIWAAAPYLHNGSVPTLAELLKPAAERASSFKVGPAYDTVNIGIAAEQTKFDYTLQTTDCSDRNSGNSRCGHEYGTNLSPDEKKALLEYLKTL